MGEGEGRGGDGARGVEIMMGEWPAGQVARTHRRAGKWGGRGRGGMGEEWWGVAALQSRNFCS